MTACNGVGWNLSRGGYGIAADVVSAARYFKRACGSDSPEACTNIGYAYDHIISDLNTATTSSHEIILLFDLNFPKKISRSPRYF